MLWSLTKKTSRIDTIIGLTWAVGMSIGIILIDLTPGYQSDFMGYLFGSMLAVDDMDLYFMVVLLVAIGLIIGFFYRDILCVSYDREYAKLKGISTIFFSYAHFGVVGFFDHYSD